MISHCVWEVHIQSSALHICIFWLPYWMFIANTGVARLMSSADNTARTRVSHQSNLLASATRGFGDSYTDIAMETPPPPPSPVITASTTGNTSPVRRSTPLRNFSSSTSSSSVSPSSFPSSSAVATATDGVGEVIVELVCILWCVLSACIVFLFDSGNVVIGLLKWTLNTDHTTGKDHRDVIPGKECSGPSGDGSSGSSGSSCRSGTSGSTGSSGGFEGEQSCLTQEEVACVQGSVHSIRGEQSNQFGWEEHGSTTPGRPWIEVGGSDEGGASDESGLLDEGGALEEGCCKDGILDVNRNLSADGGPVRRRLLKVEDHEAVEDAVSRTDSGIEMMEPLTDEPSIFGTLAKDKPKNEGSPKRTAPQTTTTTTTQQTSHHVTTATHKPISLQEKHVVGSEISRTCNGHHPVEKAPEIKKEEKSGPALVYQDGSLVSGTLEAFVQHLVPTATYYPDRTYLFAFLLSSRLFIKPHQLLNDVCQVCIRQQRLTSKDVDREAFKKFGPNLMQLLSEWTETFPYDFRDERMMRHLKDITQKCIAVDPALRKSAGQLMQGLIRRLATLEKYEDVLARVNTAASERMLALRANPASFQMNIMDVCPHPHVLAQQLTHIELERLTNIGPEEFVQSFIKSSDSDGQHMKFQDLKRTKNLEAYVEWFNRLSFLVATEVCMHIKKKHRARLIEYFTDVARECFNIGNFNSLMAIMSGLNMSPVARLKKTWNKVNTDKFDCLEHQMDPTSNFATYRQSLTAAMQRALSAQEGACDKIVIPFFSLLVKDLYFLNEGCSNKMPNGYLNFEKFWQLAKQVTNFMTWKSVECPYPRDRQALNYLLTAPVFSENSLNLASYESESPETDFEKNQYKSLKLQCTSTTAKSS